MQHNTPQRLARHSRKSVVHKNDPLFRPVDIEFIIMSGRVSWQAIMALRAYEKHVSSRLFNGIEPVICIKGSSGFCDFLNWINISGINRYLAKTELTNNVSHLDVKPNQSFGRMAKGKWQAELARSYSYSSLRTSMIEQFARHHSTFGIPDTLINLINENPDLSSYELGDLYSKNVSRFNQSMPMRQSMGCGMVVNPVDQSACMVFASTAPEFCECPHVVIGTVQFNPRVQRTEKLRSLAICLITTRMLLMSHRNAWEGKDDDDENNKEWKQFAQSIPEIDKCILEVLNHGVDEAHHHDKAPISETYYKHDNTDLTQCKVKCVAIAAEVITKAFTESSVELDKISFVSHQYKRNPCQKKPIHRATSSELSRIISPKFINEWGWNAYNRQAFMDEHADAVLLYSGSTNLWIHNPVLLASRSKNCKMIVIPSAPNTMGLKIASRVHARFANEVSPHTTSIFFENYMSDTHDGFYDSDMNEMIATCEEMGLSMIYTKRKKISEKARVLCESQKANIEHIYFAVNADYFAGLLGLALSEGSVTPAILEQKFLLPGKKTTFHVVVEPYGEGSIGKTFEQVSSLVWPEYPFHTWPTSLKECMIGFEGTVQAI